MISMAYKKIEAKDQDGNILIMPVAVVEGSSGGGSSGSGGVSVSDVTTLINQNNTTVVIPGDTNLQEQITNITNTVNQKVNSNDVYIKTTTDTLLADKADKLTTYTKAEVDSELAKKTNKVDGVVEIESPNIDLILDTNLGDKRYIATLNSRAKTLKGSKDSIDGQTSDLTVDEVVSLLNIPKLDMNNKIDFSYLPDALMGATNYRGLYDASKNNPDITIGVKNGYYWIVNVVGTNNPLSIKANVGDRFIYDGSGWGIIRSTNEVISVNDKSGVVVLNKEDIGLANVDNTSDLNKPISTLTQEALNNKVDSSTYETFVTYVDNTKADKTSMVTSTTPVNHIGYIGENNNLIDTGIMLINGVWVFDKPIQVPSGTQKFGEVLSVKEAGSNLILVDETEGGYLDRGYMVVDYAIDSTGSKKPTYYKMIASSNLEYQPLDNLRLTGSTTTFSITPSNRRLITKLTFKAGNAMDNFRFKITHDASGVVMKTYPDSLNKNTFDTGKGTSVGSGLFTIDLKQSKFITFPNQSITITIKADSLDLKAGLVNNVTIPYISFEYQDLVETDLADMNDINTINTSLANKANTSDITAINTALTSKADTSYVNTSLNTKADAATTYTKTQVDTALSSKADASTTYTKTEVDTALNLKANKTEVPILDVNNKISTTNLPDAILGALKYQGTYDVATNTPNITSLAQKGYYWVASSAGTFNSTTIRNKDWIVYNGTSWDIIESLDAVSSVAGKVGNVSLTKADVGLGLVDNTADAAKVVLSSSKLTTPRNITINGDITSPAASFDGSADLTLTTTLPNTGVTAGTYPKVSVNSKGLVTSGTTLIATDIPLLNSTSMPALTGDITSVSGTTLTSLKAVGTPGTYTKVTTDVNGRVTLGETLLTGDLPNITTVGTDVTYSNTNSQLTLVNTGVTAGTYGSNSNPATITVDSKGRITSVTNSTPYSLLKKSVWAQYSAFGNNNATISTSLQAVAPTTSGTLTAVPYALTNYYTASNKLSIASAATAGSIAGFFAETKWSVLKGFRFSATFSIHVAALANLRLFVGLRNTSLTNVAIAAINPGQQIGCYFDLAGSVMNVISAGAGAGIATATTVPAQISTVIYTFTIDCPPGATTPIPWTLSSTTNGTTFTTASGTFAAANLPTAALGASLQAVTTAAASVAVGLIKVHVEEW